MAPLCRHITDSLCKHPAYHEYTIAKNVLMQTSLEQANTPNYNYYYALVGRYVKTRIVKR